MRQLDSILISTLEVLEYLEHRLPSELAPDGSDTIYSIETKNRINALRISIIEDVKASIVSHRRRSMRVTRKAA